MNLWNRLWLWVFYRRPEPPVTGEQREALQRLQQINRRLDVIESEISRDFERFGRDAEPWRHRPGRPS